MAELVAKLVGEDSGLQDALEGVARASREVNETLEKLDDTLSEISTASETAESGVEDLSESTKDVRNSSAAATETAKKLNDEFRSTTIRAETANIFVGQLGSEITKTAGKSEALQTSISGLNSENLQLAATANLAKREIDDMGDEATETTGELIGAASASELLSLQSSALSINVGAFTVALRNLTTQVPVLVATLGNLSSAFIGLGGAIGASGIGGAALAFGGLLAKAENAGADLNDFESVLSALEPTSQALQEALIEAFRPIIEAEGAVALLDSLIQALVDTVSSFSSVVADAFEGSFVPTQNADALQSLSTTFSQIGESFRENLDAINEAIGLLVLQLGDDLAGITDSVLSGFPSFIQAVTVATEEVIAITGIAGDSFSRFVSEISNLGRTIASGVAPVFDTFFGILADVAAEINSLNAETVAAAVQMIALVLAVNRLAGIMGSLSIPIGLAAANLAKFSATAGGAISGFKKTLGGLGTVIASQSSGIGRLAEAFELVIPPLGETESSISSIVGTLETGDSRVNKINESISNLIPSFDEFRSSLSLTDRKLTSLFTETNFGKAFSERIKNSIETADLGDAFRSIARTPRGMIEEEVENIDISRGDIVSPTEVRALLPKDQKFQVNRQLELISDVDAQETLSGIPAINQRLIRFRDNVIEKIRSLNRGAFGELIRFRNIFDNALEGIREDSEGGVGGAIRVIGERIRSQLTDISESITSAARDVGDSLKTSLAQAINSISIPDIRDRLAIIRSNINDFSANVELGTGLQERLNNFGENFEIGTGLQERLNNFGENSEIGTGLQGRLNEFGENVNLPSFGELKDSVRNTFVELPSNIRSSLPSMESMENKVDDLILKLTKLRLSSITSSGSFTALAAKASTTKSGLQDVGKAVEQLAGKEVIAEDKTDGLAEELRDLAIANDASEDQADQLSNKIEELRNDELLAGLSTEELKDELRELDIQSEITEDSVDDLGGGFVSYSIKARLASLATAGFSFSMTALLSVVGVLAGALVALVVVVGTVGAVLHAVGESGQSAEELLESLKNTLLRIGEAVMPFVIESTELMMDVFNSLAAVGSELIEGFSEIAVELGLIEDPVNSSAGGMEGFITTLENVARSIGSVLDTAGKLVRIIAGKLIVTIRNVTDTFVKFLDKINAKERFNSISGFFSGLVDDLGGLENIIKTIIDITGAFVSALLKMSILIGVLAAVAFIAFGGVSALNGALAITTGFLSGLLSPITLVIAAIVLVVGAIGLLLDQLGLLDPMVNAVIGSVELLINGFFAIIDIIVAVGEAIFNLFSPVVDAVMLVVGAFEALGRLIGSVAAVVNDILGKAIELLIGAFDLLIQKGINILVKEFNNAKRAAADLVTELFNFLNIGDEVEFVIEEFNKFKEFINNIPEIAKSAFQELVTIVEDELNSAIKVINRFIEKFNKMAENTAGVDTIETLEKVDITKSGDLARASNNANEATRNARPDPADADRDTVEQGGETTKEAGEAVFSGSNSDVNVNEGDTTNVFNQSISAEPEDEAQMGRIAKDAMEEAESFKRRQQGSQ